MPGLVHEVRCGLTSWSVTTIENDQIGSRTQSPLLGTCDGPRAFATPKHFCGNTRNRLRPRRRVGTTCGPHLLVPGSGALQPLASVVCSGACQLNRGEGEGRHELAFLLE